jgi:phosphohistidine phosphatase
MDLYIIRHAEAEAIGPDLDDARRALTAKGRRSFARAVRGLERLDVAFDRIYHSPLLRAVETADLLVPLLERDGQTCVMGELAEPPREEMLRVITGDRVALVGHEPHVSELVGLLMLGWRVFDPESQPAMLEFKKGAVAWLVGDARPGEMSLAAFWTPTTLKQLAKK